MKYSSPLFTAIDDWFSFIIPAGLFRPSKKEREGKKGAFAKLLLLDPLLSWRCAFFGLSSFVSSLIDTMVVKTKRQEICKTHWTWEML